MSDLKVNSLVTALEAYHKAYPEQRKGQAFFNVLHHMYPEVANKLRGTDKDPFYRDELLDAAWEVVMEDLS